ncbi:MAG: antibiotic biosynthesis monooxygenase [Calditrichaeota bacterium]|nr:MAG: antibiotic biosynthesis monooxygenase [Calditrichota bacterium]MBL1204326.1 antibiotic biosynthesis monooxygenase [Calditrichota bacterium]NOG44155.1 antibiotic biosynthesis monooxygenase [Calditrichota bacterium]
MIKRIWHGWTTQDNAEKYFDVLIKTVIPGIEEKKISGYKGFEVLRKENGDEVEFVTIITFESLQNVIDFQGEDYTVAYVPDAARVVLKRWDQHCLHYESLK